MDKANLSDETSVDDGDNENKKIQENQGNITDMIVAMEICDKIKNLVILDSKCENLSQFADEVRLNAPVSDLRNSWKNVTELCDENVIQGNCLKTIKLLSSDATCLSPEDCNYILNEIQRTKVELAKQSVKNGWILSSVIIVCQIYQLKKVFDEIKDANNVIDESDRKIKSIEVVLSKLKDEADKLKTMIEDFENDFHLSEKEKEKLMNKIRDQYIYVKFDYSNVFVMIEELKFMIDGKISGLKFCRTQQLSNLLANFSHAIVNLIQFFQLRHLLSSVFNWIQGGVVSAFSALVVGNGVAVKMTNQKLNELREILKQIDELNQILNEIFNIIRKAEQWRKSNDPDFVEQQP